MSSNYNDTTRIRQYLLGQLAGDGLDEFEQRLFTDDQLFDEVLATEDELIESSIAGELGQDEAEQFAKYFLITPERQQKLQFRKTLQRVTRAAQHEPLHNLKPVQNSVPWQPPSWMNWITASVAAMIIVGATISISRSPQITFAELALNAGSSQREAGRAASRIRLPLQQNALKLHLALPPPPIPAKAYRVEMLTDDNKTRTVSAVSPNEQVVDVVIPTSELARGQYEFKVYAIKSDGSEQRIPGSYSLAVD